jgi:hypothetical protein
MSTLTTLLACLILLSDTVAQALGVSPWAPVLTTLRDSAVSVLSFWVIWKQ